MPEHSINTEIAHEIHQKRSGRDGEGTGRRHERLELIEAFLLAAVAIATAWSGYQAARWDGRSASSYAHGAAYRIDGDNAITLGGEQRLQDAATFNTWLLAKMSRNDEMAMFLERRFSKDYEPAFRTWLAKDPFKNHDVPHDPVVLAAYKNQLEKEGAELRQKSKEMLEQGHVERETGEDYVRLTVFLATVLFLVAVAQRFSGRSPQMILLSVAAVATTVVVIMLLISPLA
jgi:hypothetical protein